MKITRYFHEFDSRYSLKKQYYKIQNNVVCKKKNFYRSYTTEKVLQWIRLDRTDNTIMLKSGLSNDNDAETAMSTTPVIKGNQFCLTMKTRHEIAFGPQLLVKHGPGETATLTRLPNI